MTEKLRTCTLMKISFVEQIGKGRSVRYVFSRGKR